MLRAARRASAPSASRAPVRAGLALAAFAAILLAGCGNPAPDPGATRSESQSKDLRDRIQQIQGRN